MKTMIAALALVSLAACNTEKQSVADDSAANMPKAESCESSKACDPAAAKGSCEASKPACCTAAKPQG